MTLVELICLSLVCFISIIFITFLFYRDFFRVRLNFNMLFSLLYLLTFYLGFPLTCILMLKFDTVVIAVDYLLYAQLAAIVFYIIYYIVYKTSFLSFIYNKKNVLFNMNKTETYLTCMLLIIVAFFTIIVFFIKNGFLLFKLEKYSLIFSNQVSYVGLKRFFYFFIPAMLIVYFLQATKKRWFFFLISTIVFGFLSYVIVGGTRANIIISFALFLFIGVIRGWIKLWTLIIALVVCVSGMFWLALKRYGIDIGDKKIFYTLLYLTRDTFSPWENLALILSYYNKIDFQGISPIIHDFYVFIPSWIWPDRPDVILNSTNYFTRKILNNYSGLSISPTLIGSLIIMGGFLSIPFGAIVVGLIIKWFDFIYYKSLKELNRYKSAILQSFCFGSIFNIIILIREGIDSFVSRFFFFCIIFWFCLILSKLLYWFFENTGFICIKTVSNLKN
ncbi:Putative ECA polymerase [Candidatus Providencia siddallii]|uniref:Putative ECA polymerase n=1 Tax=Candidatus Providencia siddallii TaxID=1715285 RepID=A0A0M6W9T6_9GAMM|nr:Putative ECA polymerase [Candidatus Providencia siddallii]